FFFFSSRRRHTRSKRDWSSDVCSSDLIGRDMTDPAKHLAQLNVGRLRYELDDPCLADFLDNLARVNAIAERSEGFVWRLEDETEIGRASCRERVEISVAGVSEKEKKVE